MFDPVATVLRHHNNAMSYTVILAFFGQKSHEIFWNLRNTTHCDSAVVSLCRSLFTRHQALWLVSLYITEAFFLRKFSLLYRNDLTCRPEVRLQSIPPVEDVDRHVVMLYGQQRGGWCSSPPSPQQLKGVVHKRRHCDFRTLFSHPERQKRWVDANNKSRFRTPAWIISHSWVEPSLRNGVSTPMLTNFLSRTKPTWILFKESFIRSQKRLN